MRLTTRLLCLALAGPVLIPGLAQAQAPARTNDLLRVYELAVRNDTSIRAAQYARDAALEARPQARAALLPQLNSSYSYGYSESESTGTSIDTNTGAPVGFVRSNDGTDRSLSVSLSQTLFSLSDWRRLQQSSQQVALAQAVYRSNEQNLLLRVSEAYFGVLGARDSLRSAQAEKAAVERQLEQAKRRFEVGLSAITDVQEAQARYDLTVATELGAQQTLAAAEEALTEITKDPVRDLATLQDDIPLPAPTPSSVDQWVSYAKDSNLDLLASQLTFNIAARGVDVAKAQHLPTLGLSGRYTDSSSEAGAFPSDSTTSSVGLGVTLPLFSGGATQSGVRQAVATREQRQAEFEGTGRLVERNTRNAFQGVVTGAAQVKALKQAVLSSRTALEASETGLEVGTRTAVDVLNAQQQLYLAERNYYQSRYDYLLSVLRLKSAAGRLSTADLAEIDALLVQL